jgi:hypothetical protein
MNNSKRTVEDRLKVLTLRQNNRWEKSRNILIGKLECQLNAASRGFNTRSGPNKSEAEFFEKAKEAGWVVSKRGWPDFFMWNNGKIACVEVKRNHIDHLKESQIAIMSALASYGVPCFTWRPDTGFERFKDTNVEKNIKAALKPRSTRRKYSKTMPFLVSK